MEDLPLELGIHLSSFLTLEEWEVLSQVSHTLRHWIRSQRRVRVPEGRVLQWDFLRLWSGEDLLPEIDGWISVPHSHLLRCLRVSGTFHALVPLNNPCLSDICEILSFGCLSRSFSVALGSSRKAPEGEGPFVPRYHISRSPDCSSVVLPRDLDSESLGKDLSDFLHAFPLQRLVFLPGWRGHYPEPRVLRQCFRGLQVPVLVTKERILGHLVSAHTTRKAKLSLGRVEIQGGLPDWTTKFCLRGEVRCLEVLRSMDWYLREKERLPFSSLYGLYLSPHSIIHRHLDGREEEFVPFFTPLLDSLAEYTITLVFPRSEKGEIIETSWEDPSFFRMPLYPEELRIISQLLPKYPLRLCFM